MTAAYASPSLALYESFSDSDHPPPLPKLSRASHASPGFAVYAPMARNATSDAAVEATTYTSVVPALKLAASLLERNLMTVSASASAAALAEPRLDKSRSFSSRKLSGLSGGAVAPRVTPIGLSACGRSGGFSGNEAVPTAVSPILGMTADPAAASPRPGVSASVGASKNAGLMGIAGAFQAPQLGSANRLIIPGGLEVQVTGRSAQPSFATTSPMSIGVGCCGSDAAPAAGSATACAGGISIAGSSPIGGGPSLLSSTRRSAEESSAAAGESASRWRVTPNRPELGALSASPSSVAFGSTSRVPALTTNCRVSVRADGTYGFNCLAGDQALNASFTDGSPLACTSSVQEIFPTISEQPFQFDRREIRRAGSLPPAARRGHGFHGGAGIDSVVALNSASASMEQWPRAASGRPNVSSTLARPTVERIPWLTPPPLPPMSAELRLRLQAIEARQESHMRADKALEQQTLHVSAQLAKVELAAKRSTILEVELERCREHHVAAAEVAEPSTQARIAQPVEESKRRHRDLMEQHLLGPGQAQEVSDVKAEEHASQLRDAQLLHDNEVPTTQSSRSLDIETRTSATAARRAERAAAALSKERRLHQEERCWREDGERHNRRLQDDMKDSQCESQTQMFEREREIETHEANSGQRDKSQIDESVQTFERTIREHQMELAALRGQLQQAMGESAQKASELEETRNELAMSRRANDELLIVERHLRERLTSEQGNTQILNMELERLKAECDSMRTRLKMKKDGETMRRHSIVTDKNSYVQKISSQLASRTPAQQVVEVDITSD
eukprot:TRINITY_DN8985_c2_g1_i1.p1 TRINITY_DN8985_c2_g1~~TRINITY_DN8985_c2_g1_i1.p1  ORF type:complete len:796 (-),score=132.66 TRINITY_DN8985_c2_g1_i1:223-2610(-)